MPQNVKSISLSELPLGHLCRGTKVSAIPEPAIPDVLLRLARAADELGHMPPRAINPAPVYQQLASALNTLGVAEERWKG